MGEDWEEHLRKVASTQQRDWYERQPIFLLACRASTHRDTLKHDVREVATPAL
jgi:hypothetical protein